MCETSEWHVGRRLPGPHNRQRAELALVRSIELHTRTHTQNKDDTGMSERRTAGCCGEHTRTLQSTGNGSGSEPSRASNSKSLNELALCAGARANTSGTSVSTQSLLRCSATTFTSRYTNCSCGFILVFVFFSSSCLLLPL